MGYSRTWDFLCLAGEEVALQDHLTGNLFPPQPDAYAIAKHAIEAVMADEGDTVLVANRTAQDVIDDLHLQVFIDFRQMQNEGELADDEDL